MSAAHQLCVYSRHSLQSDILSLFPSARNSIVCRLPVLESLLWNAGNSRYFQTNQGYDGEPRALYVIKFWTRYFWPAVMLHQWPQDFGTDKSQLPSRACPTHSSRTRIFLHYKTIILPRSGPVAPNVPGKRDKVSNC